MYGKRKSVLFALVFMAMLIIPAGLVGAGVNIEANTGSDEMIVETDHFTDEAGNVNGKAIAKNGAIIEKVSSEDAVNIFGDDVNFEMDKSSLVGRTVDPNQLRTGVSFDDVASSSSVDTSMVRIPKSMMLDVDPTRATDKEEQNDDDDQANGTKIMSGETVTGEFFSDSAVVNPQSDFIDWFKIQVPQGNVNPVGGSSGSVYNYSFTLTEFSSPDSTLEEYQDDGEFVTSDYVDTLMVYVYFFHKSWSGWADMGGKEMFYDDGDSGDGWIHNDEDNWTLSFRTPTDSMGTVEDPDGFGTDGTFTERGWFYIGVEYLPWTVQAEEDRDYDWTVEYEFEVQQNDLEFNNYPFSESYTEGAGNDWRNATSTDPSGRGRVDSAWNNADWYELSGVDREKIWNLTADFTLFKDSIDFRGMRWPGLFYPDLWINVWRVFYSFGLDNIEGTEDDGWYGSRITLTFNYPSVSDMNVWNMNTAFNNQNPQFENILVSNLTHLPTELQGNDPRSFFIGISTRTYNMAVDTTGQILGMFSGIMQGHIDYSLDFIIDEKEPNVPPEIADISVESDWDQAETGGYYKTEFTIYVTYLDVENDEPLFIWLEIDGDTPIDLLEEGDPLNPKDKDYTDADPNPGKVYYINFLGEQLGESPSPHEIRAWAIDKMPLNDIRTSKRSLDVWDFNMTVWDDDPVSIIDSWEGIPTLTEDEPERMIPLEGFEGAFTDPERKFRGFNIWNESLNGGEGAWDSDYDSDLMSINISKVDGIWQMSINLKHNQWTSEGEPVKIRAYDDHSEINRTTRIFVNSVNDPPMVYNIIYDGMEYDVDNEIDPMRPVLHIEDSDDIFMTQDEEFTFEIIAEDTDPEEDWGTLTYDFEDGLSDNWKESPDVGYNDGLVTYTPVNYDVEKENSKMAFSISDGDSDGTIILTVYFNVKNKNDAPSISIPATTPRQYTQYQGGGIRIKPIAEDDDLKLPTSMRDSLTFSVNFEESLEFESDEIDSLEDQLPYMEVTKDIDWGIDPNTGEFWFNPNDQNIWKTSAGWVKSVEITLVFQVMDKEGDTATDKIILVLNDLNEEPPAPDAIKATPNPSTDIFIGDEINFRVDPVIDPDGDKIVYKWDFGDGATSEGVDVNHTYSKKGFKTVQVSAYDGQFETEKISLRIEILEKTGDDTQTDDDDTPINTGGSSSSNDNTMFIILAIVAVLVIIIVVVILVVVLRKKEAPPAQQYAMYDQSQLAGYDAMGLPPGQAPGLPGAETPELPPGQTDMEQPQELPPATQEMAPQYEAPAPQMETQAQPEPAPGSACPSCGSQVDPSWFLCPNCKSPLQ